VYMRQEKLRLLVATGSAGHRNVQVGTGWHSQHGQQEKACCTAMRLYREGLVRGGKKEKSGATVTDSRSDQSVSQCVRPFQIIPEHSDQSVSQYVSMSAHSRPVSALSKSVRIASKFY